MANAEFLDYSGVSRLVEKIKDTITSLATSIAQTKADAKNNAIIAAALIGHEVETISTSNVSSVRRPKGTFAVISVTSGVAIVYKFYYFYSDTAAPLELTVDNLVTIKSKYNFSGNTAPYKFVSKTSWSTLTPITDANSQISAIYKGETVGNFTKWIIIFNTGTGCETEDQLYYARSKSNSSLVYGKYQYKYPFTTYFNAPWELWLPKSAATGSVVISY